MQFLETHLDCGLRVRRVIDSKVLRVAEELAILAKKTHEDGVKCPHHHLAGFHWAYH